MPADSIQCPACGNRYDVPPILLEKSELRVRCPACRKRFTLRRPARSEAAREDVRQAAIPAEHPETPGAVEPDPAHLERKARRLAKALVEQILQGRRSRRDRALAEGRLILEFGPQIQQIWRVYEDKVGTEMARRSPHFRNALNEILADGNEIF
jgi:predicted  nucleic acid-binding Zn-ribbon protein